jgi:hypothetical protein
LPDDPPLSEIALGLGIHQGIVHRTSGACGDDTRTCFAVLAAERWGASVHNPEPRSLGLRGTLIFST